MPADTKDILAHAEKLGQMLVDHPAVEKYKAAQKAIADDTDARSLMGDFNRMIEALARQEQQGLSITDAQRLSLEALQTKLASNIKVKAMNIAQMDFMDLLRKVSESWQKPLGGAMGGAAAESAARPGPQIVGA
ncbi:MAG TPA: YlbF family regulator [Tepidisphaeraceae bacterium]|nr:YlbF family regulator [Tepidisphaeraceae bacterium]